MQLILETRRAHAMYDAGRVTQDGAPQPAVRVHNNDTLGHGWGVSDAVIDACCVRLGPRAWRAQRLGYSLDTTRLPIQS